MVGAQTGRGPVIRLHGGPRDRWEYYEQNFLDCVRAAQEISRLHSRPSNHPASWPLSYGRPTSGLIWVWRQGENCHPNLMR